MLQQPISITKTYHFPHQPRHLLIPIFWTFLSFSSHKTQEKKKRNSDSFKESHASKSTHEDQYLIKERKKGKKKTLMRINKKESLVNTKIWGTSPMSFWNRLISSIAIFLNSFSRPFKFTMTLTCTNWLRGLQSGKNQRKRGEMYG